MPKSNGSHDLKFCEMRPKGLQSCNMEMALLASNPKKSKRVHGLAILQNGNGSAILRNGIGTADQQL
jgi:hypothetical protein